MAVTYLAIDPGITCGWAAFSETGDLIDCDQISWQEMGSLLDKHTLVKVIIVEDYVVRPHVSHGGSRVEAIQVIGMVKEFCRKNDIQMVLQPPRIKKVGYAWAQLKKPSRHNQTHHTDAIAHGVYYLQKNGIRKSVLDES